MVHARPRLSGLLFLLAGWSCGQVLSRALPPPPPAGEKPQFSAVAEQGWLTVKDPRGQPVFRYRLSPFQPSERAPSVDSVGFLHPLLTPSGTEVTDLAPSDHPHHRGIFLGWVEMMGERRADFWGWGAKAPKDNRRIVNRSFLVESANRAGVTIRVKNSWLADGEEMLAESSTIRASQRNGNIVDLEFRLAAPGVNVQIAPSPFGGFCYRAKPAGRPEITGPEGVVTLSDSVSDRAETTWPDRPWYDLSYHSPDLGVKGVAVMNHPRNPRTTWFVNRALHMLNPCIVAGQPFTISRTQPLVLRYRVVAHDGDAASTPLRELYTEFQR